MENIKYFNYKQKIKSLRGFFLLLMVFFIVFSTLHLPLLAFAFLSFSMIIGSWLKEKKYKKCANNITEAINLQDLEYFEEAISLANKKIISKKNLELVFAELYNNFIKQRIVSCCFSEIDLKIANDLKDYLNIQLLKEIKKDLTNFIVFYLPENKLKEEKIFLENFLSVLNIKKDFLTQAYQNASQSKSA